MDAEMLARWRDLARLAQQAEQLAEASRATAEKHAPEGGCDCDSLRLFTRDARNLADNLARLQSDAAALARVGVEDRDD